MSEFADAFEDAFLAVGIITVITGLIVWLIRRAGPQEEPMNIVLNLLAICALIVVAPMALASLLLTVAYSIGITRVWLDGRRLRQDFERIVGEQVQR